MAKVEIVLPSMGEGVIEATITKWLVSEGDQVEEDQSLVEVATDKVDSEIPAPEDGIITQILMKEGEVPKVGEVLAILENDKPGESLDRPEVLAEVEKIKLEIAEKEEEKEEVARADKDLKSRTPGGKFLSPLVRKIALEEGISYEELDNVQGTGHDGRLTRDDIMDYLKARKEGKPASAPVPEAATPATVPEVAPAATTVPPKTAPAAPSGISSGPDVEVIEMDRMRKIIADHMVVSKQTSPHVTSFIEADVTGLVRWRENIKDSFFAREKQKITYTPVFIEAAAKALRDFPMVNVSVDGTRILKKRRVNIGMATALPDGNLIVPVIKDADEKSLLGLAKAVNDLAVRARTGKLQPDEIQGGTFTITNFGSFDNLTGTPIINQPEVAILGVGAIRKQPAVIETSDGDAIAIRQIMILSLAYDHRVVDGALGGRFLKRVAEYLEGFDTSRSV
ncbi:MAG: 2-oxo acid dehydrogenase subunit E2 [Chlorobi bacterium]|nr:2-oxo acid dehydrogenase subunit E2 [Chlorobiota bacterium]